MDNKREVIHPSNSAFSYIPLILFFCRNVGVFAINAFPDILLKRKVQRTLFDDDGGPDHLPAHRALVVNDVVDEVRVFWQKHFMAHCHLILESADAVLGIIPVKRLENVLRLVRKRGRNPKRKNEKCDDIHRRRVNVSRHTSPPRRVLLRLCQNNQCGRTQNRRRDIELSPI